MPVSADGDGWSRRCTPPNPPRSGIACERLSVSPVSSKKNVRKPVPGWNCPFSGRLNGVALAAFAAALALNGAVPSIAVSWIVTHFVANVWP